MLRRLALALLLCGVPAMPLHGQPRTVTVQAGDTLEQLALKHGVSLKALIARNGIHDPTLLQVGQVLVLPEPIAATQSKAAGPKATNPPTAAAPERLTPPAPDAQADTPAEAQAALLLSPAERRDRAELELRESSGLARWKWFNATAVDWAGWRLHPGGVRITLVKPSAADLGLRGSGATAMAVQCTSLRQNWRVDGRWQGWENPQPGSVGQRIVVDLCSNTLDGPAVPLPPPP